LAGKKATAKKNQGETKEGRKEGGIRQRRKNDCGKEQERKEFL